MFKGKRTCKILKEIRKQIAQNNDIEFVTSECKHQGDCLGTCPKCEAEVRYLERELEKRQKLGRTIAVAGLAVALTTSTVGCDELLDIIHPPLGGAPLDPVEEELYGDPDVLRGEEILALQGVPSWQELPSLLEDASYVHILLSHLAFLEVTQEDIYAAWGDACIRELEDNSEVYEFPLPDGHPCFILMYGENGTLMEWEALESVVPDIEVAVRRGEDWTREWFVNQEFSVYDELYNNATWQDAYLVGKNNAHLYPYTYNGQDMCIYVYYDATGAIIDVQFEAAWAPSLATIAAMGEEWARQELIGSKYEQHEHPKLWKEAKNYVKWTLSHTGTPIVMYAWTYMEQDTTMYLTLDFNHYITDVVLSDAHVPSWKKFTEMEEAAALDILQRSKICRDMLHGVWNDCLYDVIDNYEEYRIKPTEGFSTAKVRIYYDENDRIIDVKITPDSLKT